MDQYSSSNDIVLDVSKFVFSDSLILAEIYARVAEHINANGRSLGHPPNAYREEISSLNTLIDTLSANLPSIAQFQDFLANIHDIIVVADTNFRAILLRVIRICISCTNDEAYCDSLLFDDDIVWLVVTSLDVEAEFVPERMQAVKIMKVTVTKLPLKFPLSFARSLVAIANQTDDQLRRVCLEVLRLLCTANTALFAKANGIPALVEAILDPNLSDISEALLLSLLHAMNDEQSRYVAPFQFSTQSMTTTQEMPVSLPRPASSGKIV